MPPRAGPPARPPHLPQPRETPERCALRAQLRGDPMLGTAFPADRLLLVEQPGPWGSRGLRDSHFDPDVAARLETAARAAGVRVQVVRRFGRTPRGAVRRWAFADTRDGHVTVVGGDYQRDEQLLGLDLAAPTGPAGEPIDGPLYLVCAHSRHDVCCAVRGRSVAAALDAVRPGRVLETSHLGGCRFAANVLVLPVGLLYGRVLPFAAPEFVAAAEAGEVVGALLRGRIGLPPAAQAALAYAHEHLAVRRRRDLQVVSSTPPVDGVATVRIRGPHGELEVTVQVEPTAVTGLVCRDPRPGTFLAYRPTLVREL